MSDKKSCILFTPGVDSFYLLRYLHHCGTVNPSTVDLVHFLYCSTYSDSENQYLKNMSAIDDVTRQYQLIFGETLCLSRHEQPDFYLPNRNLLFIMTCVTMGYDTIYIGGTRSDRVNDNNEKTLNEYSSFLSMVHKRHIQIISPFWNYYKNQIGHYLTTSYDVRLPVDVLNLTFSCYTPQYEENKYFHCYNCSACFRRNCELFSIGMFVPFKNKEIFHKYLKEVQNTIDIENHPRMLMIRNYLKKLVDVNPLLSSLQ